MPPRTKTAVKKKRSLPTKAKKVTKRAAKHRETPLEKLAFRVSILEEGFNALEKDLRDLRRSYGEHVVLKLVESEITDVAPEPAKMLDESSAHTEPVLSDDEL
jgi:ABC-type uncharacterized transport system ATPase subunit